MVHCFPVFLTKNSTFVRMAVVRKNISYFLLYLFIGQYHMVCAQSTINNAENILSKTYEQLIANPKVYATQIENVLQDKSIPDSLKAELHATIHVLYYYLGRYNLSTSYALKSIDYFEKNNKKERLGSAYCLLGYEMKRRDIKKAFEFMHKGIVILQEVENKEPYASQVNNYGVLYEMLGNYDSAKHFYEVSLKLKRSFNDSNGMTYSLNNLFELSLLTGDLLKARKFLDESTAIRTIVGDSMGIIENYSLYGDYFFTVDDYSNAILQYSKAVLGASKYKYVYLEQYSAERLSMCYEKIGNQEKALYYFKLFSLLKDSTINSETNKAIAELEISYETEKHQKEIESQRANIAQAALKVKQKNYLLAALVSLLLILGLFGFFIYKQQKFKESKLLEENKLKDQLSAVTLTSKLQKERLRISRDLHDNIGSQLTFIISSLDNLLFLLKGADDEVKTRIEKVNGFTRETISQLRDSIWAMNKDAISGEDMKERILNHLSKTKLTANMPEVKLRFSLSPDTVFRGVAGINLFRCLQEAINNALKYSQATVISVDCIENDKEILFVVKDNGKGFEEQSNTGYGLQNMKKRMEECGGDFVLKTKHGSGTEIKLILYKNTT